MHEADLNKVVFYSKEDMTRGIQLKKGESILRSTTKFEYTNVNDILELYNIKKYIDNELYLIGWTKEDISSFIQKTTEYSKIVGQFMSGINDNNVIKFYNETIREYTESFWELVNNKNIFKKISKTNFSEILEKEPYLIHNILTHKNIVEHYNVQLKNFLLTYSQSAEILLSIYDVKDDFKKKIKFIPKSLTIADKEKIISNYLDSADANLNYVELIQNVRTRNDFKISDKTRLKAKHLHKSEIDKIFADKSGIKYGVSISFPKNASKIKDGFIDDEYIANYSYDIDFIKQHNHPYSLFQNFRILFEYLDNQSRINLVSKKSQIGVFERIMGVRSQNEYKVGTTFSLSEMTSQGQIFAYNKIVSELNTSLENILHFVFTSSFQEKYDFANNASFAVPTATNSYFEKVRLLAPEFESILKKFKLFVEEGSIDFELLQISSSPSEIKHIPSLNRNKYIYFNEKNEVILGCSNLFFSDQTLLAYVEPFKEKKHNNFFDLLANEQVKFSNYEEYQKTQLNHLLDKGFLSIDSNDFIRVLNLTRLLILKDLHSNEVASFYHYTLVFREEVEQMARENIVYFESSLFSKIEQAYFSYFLNKKEFTNGLDLRNSYLHGTQARPDETNKHEYSYFTYLKLLFLVFLKIEDDLNISKGIKERK
jgi:hypothetical protein